MNPILDHDTDRELRAMDPADPLTDDHRGRAASVLASILATDPADGRTDDLVPTTRRRHPGRWVAAAGVAALAGTGLVLATAGAPKAYATWTATPSQVTEDETAKVVEACRDQLGTLGGGHEAELPPGVPAIPSISAKELDLRLAERRGDWIHVTLTARLAHGTDWSADCIAKLPAGSGADPSDVSSASSGGGGFLEPGPGQFTDGAISEFGGDGGGLLGTGLFAGDRETASSTTGRVGPDVVGVTIHSGSLSVEASVKDGTYAAWWPGTAFDHTTPLPPSGQGGPESILRYDLTLADGTVVEDATPTYPDAATPESAGSVASVTCPPTCGDSAVVEK